jgi:hypothetical protein
MRSIHRLSPPASWPGPAYLSRTQELVSTQTHGPANGPALLFSVLRHNASKEGSDNSCPVFPYLIGNTTIECCLLPVTYLPTGVLSADYHGMKYALISVAWYQ